MSERCARCGGYLTFVGFDRYGKRVGSCTANLGVKKEDGTSDSSACNLKGDYVVGGQSFQSVTWFQRREDGPRSTTSWARCRDHGQEMVQIAKRERAD